jgi:hypothetical protein
MEENKMKRLQAYFEKATTCGSERKFGIEVETLFVNDQNRPISYQVSQDMMRFLIDFFGWQVTNLKNDVILRLEKDGYAIAYELGWNNFELTTPAYCLENDFSEYERMMKELYWAGEYHKTKPFVGSDYGCWDNFLSNTVVIAEERDKIWLKLDGEALFGLGHIACVHFNFDLQSISEGMGWIQRLNASFLELGWPVQNYIRNSLVGYEETRYGPPPDNFLEYCCSLAFHKVVMDTTRGELRIVDRPGPFKNHPNPDIDLFLRSVWWYPRLRVRGGRLVLEVRDIPRAISVKQSFLMLRGVLNF